MNIIEEKYTWAYPLYLRTETKYLVLHHEAASGSTAQEIHNYHLRNGWAGIGYHYYIRKDGSIYRGRPEDTVGAHTEDYNSVSIGICFEGNYETEPTMPEAQFKAGQALIADIKTRYPDIVSKRHRDLNATACPGKYFPYNDLTGDETMTGEEIYTKLNEYLKTLDAPAWAKEELAQAVAAGITDGTNPMQLIPRYQAAIMAYRAKKGE
jgi:N-acetyl-anhydromuramyl-L-alanine amidase AmpD